MYPHFAQHLSEAEFLTLESIGAESSEFINGETLPRVREGRLHDAFSRGLAQRLRALVRPRFGMAFAGGVMVRIQDPKAYFYPDAVVAGVDEVSSADAQAWIIDEPLLIAEVLSPATEDLDRGIKWSAYRTLPSLRYYLLVSADLEQVELYSRKNADHWKHTVHAPTATLRLNALNITLDLSAVFSAALREPA